MKSTIVLATGVLTVSTLLPGPTVRASSPSNFRFVCAVGAGKMARDELLAVPLAEGLYSHCRQGTPDLRVFDDRGAETPFLIEREVGRKSVEVLVPLECKTVSVKQLAGNRLLINVRLDPDEKRTGVGVVDIVTPLRDFEKRVTVSVPGSTPGAWKVAADRRPLFDFSRFVDVRNTQVPLLLSTNAREFRIEIEDISDEEKSAVVHFSREMRGGKTASERFSSVLRRRDFRIDGVRLLHRGVRNPASVPVMRDSVVHDVSVTPGKDGATSVVGFRTDGQPLTGVRLVTKQLNFSRQARVEVPRQGPAGQEWRPIGNARLDRLSFRDVRREQLRVAFPETRETDLQLVIVNGDAPALDVATVVGTGPAYRLLMLAQQGRSYRLFLGNPKVAAPAYDTAYLRTLAAEKRNEVRTVSVEPVMENSGYRTPGGSGFESRWLLWAAVALMLVVLPWAMLRAVRKVDLAAGE